jgi:hypothetical protein
MGQRAFAGAAQAGDHGQPITGNVYVQVAKVVLASPPHLNGVSGFELHGGTGGQWLIVNGRLSCPTSSKPSQVATIDKRQLTIDQGFPEPYRLPLQATS